MDFLWWVPEVKGWGGVQRKEVKDFIASARDGRLTKELGQMTGLAAAMVVIEGRMPWINDCIVVNDWTKMTREEFLGILMRIQGAGVKVSVSEGIPATVKVVRWFERWSKKPDHTTLTTRPGPPTNSWGTHQDRDFGLWVLQGFPGVGAELAERIWEHFGGMPLGWKVTEEELCQVKGIGKAKARKLMSALGS